MAKRHYDRLVLSRIPLLYEGPVLDGSPTEYSVTVTQVKVDEYLYGFSDDPGFKVDSGFEVTFE